MAGLFYGQRTRTDRHPPFTMGSAGPGSPDYPEQQRRGSPLIGWWLLGIPQYAIAGLLSGGGRFVGIVGILVIVLALVLLFKNRYLRDVFDVAMGFNRWVVRATAYALLMTPQYPPFRLDPGATEPTRSE